LEPEPRKPQTQIGTAVAENCDVAAPLIAGAPGLAEKLKAALARIADAAQLSVIDDVVFDRKLVHRTGEAIPRYRT
jgi:hypothetical protein